MTCALSPTAKAEGETRMEAVDFAARLQDVVRDERKNFRKDYIARCPACQRHTLSSGDGKSSLKLMCFFGCDVPAILAPLGLRFNDL